MGRVGVASVSERDLERIYREQFVRLVRVATAITRDEAAGVEAVQDAFVRLLRMRREPRQNRVQASKHDGEQRRRRRKWSASRSRRETAVLTKPNMSMNTPPATQIIEPLLKRSGLIVGS
jgi:DNA-directed RNA polymerase specialized sigma24 family protein